MFVLIRDKRTETAILGRLFLGDRAIAYTLENASKAIPVGFYGIQNSTSPKFKRELPLIYSRKVSASRGIRIHRGNSYKDSSGCILVGMGQDCAKERITESADAEKMVTLLCRKEVSLAIVDA